jgi:4-amino-4-deoxy-L-arabinose transferase-like glycosyltransferase
MRGHRLRLLAVVVLALGVRLLYLYSKAPDAPIASVDGWGYYRLALNLAQGHGFSLQSEAPYLPASVRTPLYPLFLLAVRQLLGPAPRTAALAQVLLGGATTLLTAWMGTQIAGLRAGRIAALLYALNPAQIRFTSDLLTETLLALLLLGAACALLCYLRPAPTPLGAARTPRRAWLALSAVLLALAILCKPNVQFLPLLWIVPLALRAYTTRQDTPRWPHWRGTLIDVAVLFGIVAVVLLPWYVRNERTFGRAMLSTAFEGNVSRVSVPATLAVVHHTYVAPWSPEWEALFGEVLADAAQQYAWDKPWETLTAREIETYNQQLYWVSRQVLQQHPVAWLLGHAQGMVRYLEPQTYRIAYGRLAGHPWPADVLDDAVLHALRALARGDWARAGGMIAAERWVRLDTAGRVIWWGTFLGQAIGLGLALRGASRLRHQPAALALLGLTVAYVLWVPGPIAYERFQVPVTSLIVVLIGASAVPRSRRITGKPVTTNEA